MSDTLAGGFLDAEGLRAQHSIAPAGKSALEGVVAGTVHVAQSAPSQGFGPLASIVSLPSGRELTPYVADG